VIVRAIPAWVAATNAWVVADEPGGTAFVVDAPPEPEELGEYLAQLDVAVTGILLTHGHIDHTGGSGVLARRTRAVTYVHPDDDFLTLHPAEQLRGLFGIVPPGDYEPPAEMTALAHGDLIDMAGQVVEVRHTPGHTPGHCCFLLGAEGILFSGDQLFAGSVGRTDLPGGSWEMLMASMRDRVLTLDDDVRVLPGHGPETTIGRERKTNPFLAEVG
jgi:glyoxylase-like metal-dependent hydrolase (beta-lactamase superfamily II)